MNIREQLDLQNKFIWFFLTGKTWIKSWYEREEKENAIRNSKEKKENQNKQGIEG